MHRKYSKFLIVSFIGVVILGVFSYFYNNLESAIANEDSSLSSSLGTTGVSSITISGAGKATEDTAFLIKLASLTRIKIDTSIFEDQSFKLLVDNNIKLEPVPYGRTNPFSPVDPQIVYTPVVDEDTVANNKPELSDGLPKTVKPAN
jgi:hypothetical protein